MKSKIKKIGIDWSEANAACEALTENEDSLTRDIVTRLAEKWTLWTMAELAEAERSDAVFAR